MQTQTSPKQAPAQAQSPIACSYLVLDFTATVGVDATAARSCFLLLAQLLRSAGVTVVFANASFRVLALLRANGVVREGDVVIAR